MFPQKLFRSYLFTLKKIEVRHLTNASYLHHIGKEPLKYETLGNLIETTARNYPDRVAIISNHQNASLTYSETLNRADRLASQFRNIGLLRGDRVGVWSKNSLEWYVTAVACSRAGLIIVNLNPAYQPPEIEFAINKVQCKALITSNKDKDHYEIISSIAPEILSSDPGKLKSVRMPSLRTVVVVSDDSCRGTFSFDELTNREVTENSIKAIKEEQNFIQPDDPLVIMYTSGTTGKPKGTVLSHFNVINNSYQMHKRAEMNLKHHKICVPVSFFHTFGFSFGLTGSISTANTIVVPAPSYSAIKTLETIEAEKCTIVCGTPTMHIDVIDLQLQQNRDVSSLEIAITAGSTCTPHLFKKMLEVYKVRGVRTLFGMTETVAAVFQSLPDEGIEKVTETVGFISDHVEAKVVDENGMIVPMGTPGELWVRCFCNMLKYWDDEQKTNEMIGDDGWLKTGDKFIIEKDGYGKIVERIKEMINRGGENIFPKEIEDLISTHPDVVECAVIGLPHQRLGEEVCACVRIKPESKLDLYAIQEYCKHKLAKNKVPSVLKIVDDYPKTASGKIQKFKLVERYT